jgi:hypothetical protein
MPDPRPVITPDDIAAAWADPEFIALPEQQRIDIMGRMDSAFSALPMIDRRRITARMYETFTPKPVPQRGPAPLVNETAGALAQSGLPPARPAGSPAIPVPMQEVGVVDALMPRFNAPPVRRGPLPPPVVAPPAPPPAMPAVAPTQPPPANPIARALQPVPDPRKQVDPMKQAMEEQSQALKLQQMEAKTVAAQAQAQQKALQAEATAAKVQQQAGEARMAGWLQEQKAAQEAAKTEQQLQKIDAANQKAEAAFQKNQADERARKLKEDQARQKSIAERTVPGMERLGGVAPEGAPQPVPQELKRRGPLQMPKLEYDPFTGGARPTLDTPMDQRLDWQRNDPMAVGAGAAIRGLSGATLNAAGGLTAMAADATNSPTLRNVSEGLTLGDRLVQDVAARPEDVSSFDEDPVGAVSDPRWWADSIGNGMGSMIPMMASGAAAGKVISTAINRGWLTGKAADAVLKYGPSAVAGISEGLMAGGNTYNEAIEAGASPEIAREAAALVAAGTTATAFPAFKIGVFQDRIQSLGKKIVTSIAAESGQEGVQTWWENLVASKLSKYDPNRPLSRGVAEGMVGGAFGGVAGAVIEGTPQEQQQPKQAETGPRKKSKAIWVDPETGVEYIDPDKLPPFTKNLVMDAVRSAQESARPSTPVETPSTPVAPPPTAQRPAPAAEIDIEDVPSDINDILDRQDQEQRDSNPRGSTVKVKVARGYDVDAQYELVPLSSLVRSHDPKGTPNPLFPTEIQPRQRDRVASEQQITEIGRTLDGKQLGENVFASYGAPIVGEDNAVEAGNGRSNGLLVALEQNPERFRAYQQEIARSAEAFGMSPDQAREYIAANPDAVLVRRRTGDLPTGVDRATFAADANEDPQAAMSAGELAFSDSRRLTPDLMSQFVPSESGDIATSANMPFIRSFIEKVVPQGQRGSMQLPKGELSLPGIQRIRNAIFARAYNDRGIVERLTEDPDDNIKSIVGGLTIAAPKFIAMQAGIESGDLHPLDISEGITDAAAKISFLRENSIRLDDYLKNGNIFGEQPLMNAILGAFGRYGRNKTELADLFGRYTEAVEAIGNPKQAGMFGPAEVPSPEALFIRVLERKLDEDGKTPQEPQQPVQPSNPTGGTGQSGSSLGLPVQPEAGPEPATSPSTPGEQPEPEPGPAAAPVRPPSPGQVDADPYEGAPAVYAAIRNRVADNLGWKDTPDLNKFIREQSGKQVGTHLDQKQAYDAVEAAINAGIAERPELAAKKANVPKKIGKLRDLINRIAATQTTRTEGQDAAQQFSTPPHLAYVAALAADIQKGQVVLEPSAGTGSLASFAKAAGATVVTNEIDPGRRWLLRQQGFEPFAANAEQINNLLPEEIKPDVVLMNPPFSSSVTRGGKNTNENGYRHVIQALARLKPGGRLVAILGEGAKMGLPNSRNFWSIVGSHGVVLADVGIDGKEYRKYGTTFGNRLIVIQKGGAGVRLSPGNPVRGEYNSIEEVWDAIQPIFGRVQDTGSVPQQQQADGTGGVGPSNRGPVRSARSGGSRVRNPGGSSERGGRPSGPSQVPAPAGSPTPPVRSPESGPQDATGGPQGPTSSAPVSAPSSQPAPAQLTEEQIQQAIREEMIREAEKNAREAEDELRALGFYDGMNAGVPLDPRFIPPLVKYGLSVAQKGVYSFKSWSAAMLEKFAAVADKIRDSLRDIYDDVMDQLEQVEKAIRARVSGQAFWSSQPPMPQPEQITPAPAAEPEAEPQAPAAKPEEAPSTSSEPDPEAAPELPPAEKPREDLGEDDENFFVYNPAKLPTEWGAQPHRAKIVETMSMSGVSEPDIFMKPNLPQSVIETGALTEVQLPAIAHAIQAHSRELPSGERGGFFIGDGTGVGKGRTIAGILGHYWNSGTKRLIWVTKNETLVQDAQRDFAGIGMPDVRVAWVGDFKKGADLSAKFPQGVLVVSYNTLSSGSLDVGDFEKLPKALKEWAKDQEVGLFPRVAQLSTWAGEEPAIVFDESHLAKNSTTAKGKRGTAKASGAGLATVQLQKLIPKARVTYSSATGFTEPSNLGYAERLGLWGEGTAFKTFEAFTSMMNRGGIGALEMVSRDMKAQGKYLARFISYGKDKSGVPVEFDELIHPLTADQRQILDIAGQSWRTVRENFHTFFKENETDNKARAQAMSQFYGSMQRFYRTVYTSMKVPTLFREIDRALTPDPNGETNNEEQVVISVLMTGESATKRAMEQALASEEELNLDDLDVSPVKMLQELVQKAFPVQQFQTIENDSGVKEKVPVYNLDGTPALNRQAVAARDALIERLNELRMPEPAIDQIINRYGLENVAELTGRKMRLVVNPKTGQRELAERRGSADNRGEIEAFQSGKKRIAIISDAANAGVSLHSDLNEKVKRRRLHIILQLKWSADTQMQDFGRTHRTNQRIPPRYVLLALDVAGDKRFASSIARRLAQLGALSRGDRKAANAGSIDNYNFETVHGVAALDALMNEMLAGNRFPDLPESKELFEILGFASHAKFVEEGGAQAPKPPEITTFLNRITAAPVDIQNALFDRFVRLMENAIQTADRAGLLDKGTAKIDADKVELAQEPTVIRVDEATGAETIWYQLNALHERKTVDWAEVSQSVKNRGMKLFRNIESGGLAMIDPKPRSLTDEKGSLVNRFQATRPNGERQALDPETVNERWKPVMPNDAVGEEWEQQREDAGKYRKETVHLIGGSVLSVYDKFVSGDRAPRVEMADLGDRRRVLGVRIPVGRIREVLRSLGFGAKVNAAEVHERLASSGEKFTLSNGVILTRNQVQGESVMQVTLPPLAKAEMDALGERLTGIGVRTVKVQWRDRYFIPMNEQIGLPILQSLLKQFPVVRDNSGPVEFDDGSNKGPLTRRNSGEAGFIKADFLLEIARGAARMVSRRPSERPTVEVFADPKVEARVQAAGKPEEEVGGIRKRLEEANEHMKQLFRTYEFLPRDKYGALIFQMKVLEKARGTSSAKAMTDLYGMIGKMDVPTFETFRKAILVDDLMETVEMFEEQGEAIPEELAFGFTPELLRSEKARFTSLVEDNPELSAAMMRRQQVWDNIKADYMRAMRAAGVDVEGKLARKAYFRHRVLLQKQIEERIAGRKVQTPAGRSFLKRRKASALAMDYRTNFIETEFQVMTQIMTDTKMADFVSWVRDNVDIRADLEREAKSRNVAIALEYFENLADMQSSKLGPGPRITGESLFKQTLNRKQAMAVEELMKLAANGKLPDTPERKFRNVIDRLAEAHFAKKHDEEDGVLGIGSDIPGLINYAAWVLRQNQPSAASRSSATLFKGIREKREAIKRIAGDRYVEWDDLMPKGYQEYQPDPRGIYYTAYTIPEQIALKLMEEGAEAIGLTADQLTKVIAVGGQRRTMVLPDEVVQQFRKMAETKPRNEALELVKDSMRAWKAYMLMSATRFVSYTLRNTTGDFDSMLSGLPKAVLPKVPAAMTQAAKEVGAYMLPLALGNITEAKMTPRLREFHEFGGFESTLQAQEIGAPEVPKQIKALSDWETQKPPEGPLKAAIKSPVRAVAWQMRKAGEANAFREATMRYAVYNLMVDHMKANKGLPTEYGASVPAEVQSLGTVQERAYRMSNDLMGAYDEISVGGRAIRQYVIPFWSYQELNFRRYARILQNAAREGWINKKAGRMAIGAAARAPYMAYRTAELSARLVGLWALAIALNSLFGDDDKLREEVRHRPHFNFGMSDDGTEIYYFPRIGNLNDILEWFDVEEVKAAAAAIMEGKKTLGAGLWDVVRGGPLEKVFLSAGPHIKYPVEATTNLQFYPNVDRPRQVDDWYEKIAGDLGLGDAYRDLVGKPTKRRGPLERAASLAIYKADPRENAYYDILDQKRKFQTERGMADSGPSRNKPSTVILRNLKKAIRVKDYEAFKKYLTLYAAQPGASKDGLASSIRAMDPLSGLSEKKGQKQEFIRWLSNDDRRRLNMAMEYYDEVFRGNTVAEYVQRYSNQTKGAQ